MMVVGRTLEVGSLWYQGRELDGLSGKVVVVP